jgi:hypothetical protein
MGFGDLFRKTTTPEGYATRESGEEILQSDVDMARLHASRNARSDTSSWNMTFNDPGDRIPVTNSKGATGGMVFPSTQEVRNALKVTTPTQPQYTSGFSQSLADVSTPSSQVLSDPVQQEVPILEESYNWNPSQYWLGKGRSDDEPSQVGQIS